MKLHQVFCNAIVIGCGSYFVSFLLWRNFYPDGVLFYQGLILAFIVSTLQFIVQVKFMTGSSAFKDSLLTLLICYSFMFTIPTTVDRSYTVKMLIELQNYPQGVSLQQIESHFSGEFITKGGVEKRLFEQSLTGSLVATDSGYRLTPFGNFLAGSFLWVQDAFSISDVKTDQ